MNPEWHDDAACKPHPQEWWFPDGGGDDIYNEARPICRRCPVRANCLAHALAQPERFGMWGGYDTKERQAMQPNPKPFPVDHATSNGYTAHLRRKEQPCQPCIEARRQYKREYDAQRRANGWRRNPTLRVIDGGDAA